MNSRQLYELMLYHIMWACEKNWNFSGDKEASNISNNVFLWKDLDAEFSRLATSLPHTVKTTSRYTIHPLYFSSPFANSEMENEWNCIENFISCAHFPRYFRYTTNFVSHEMCCVTVTQFQIFYQPSRNISNDCRMLLLQFFFDTEIQSFS